MTVQAPPWPELQEPTAEQWLDWLLSHDDRVDRVAIAARAVHAMQKADLCLVLGHDLVTDTLRHVQNAYIELVTRPRVVEAEKRANRYRMAWLSARRFRRNTRAFYGQFLAELDAKIDGAR